jgi:hypothetical protein
MAGREPPHMGPMAHGFAALGEAAERAVSTISALAADAAQAPSRLGNIARLLTADGKLGTVWQVTLPFAGLLLGSIGAALIVSRLLGPQRKALAAFRPSGPASFAMGMLRSTIVDAAPVVAFAAIAAGGSFLLFWDRGLIFSGTGTFRMVASTIISMTVSAWLAVVLLSLPLAADRPGLRSVPLDDQEAAAVRRFIGQVVALGAASWTVAMSLYLTWIGEGLPRLLLILAGLVICTISLRALARIRSRLSGFGRIWRILAVFSVFGLGAAWIVQLLFGGRPSKSRSIMQNAKRSGAKRCGQRVLLSGSSRRPSVGCSRSRPYSCSPRSGLSISTRFFRFGRRQYLPAWPKPASPC